MALSANFLALFDSNFGAVAEKNLATLIVGLAEWLARSSFCYFLEWVRISLNPINFLKLIFFAIFEQKAMHLYSAVVLCFIIIVLS